MRKRLAILFITSLLLIISISFSQDTSVTNLLANGDFEDDFVELDGADPRNVAESWTPWHVPADDTSPSFANHDPNYDQETDRIRLDEAGSAQKYFTLFATHQGGIYQEVDSLTSGTTYRFSIYAYVWSSSFEDTEVSEDPGDVVVRVGIDPDGGTDGTSADIIWSTAATFFYDAYRQYAVIATAESPSVTVFVESTVGEPRANNYIYLDDAVLEVASETVVVVEATPTSETNTELADESSTATPSPTVTPTPSPTEEQQAGGNVGRSEQQEPPVKQEATDTPTPTPTSTETPTPTPTATATETATRTPTVTPTLDDSAASSDEFPETVEHVVVADDTLSGLALQYGSTVEAIRRANDLGESSLIVVGQRLIIPVNLPPAPDVAATATPTPTFTPTPTATPSPTATPITYQILPGDTLVNIALQYGTTVELLAAVNNIVNVHQIDVGQILLIPTAIPPTATATFTPSPTLAPTVEAIPQATTDASTASSYTTYIVQIGDTLDEIARDHDTTIQAIVQLNSLTDPSRIDPGQELKIPSAGGTAPGQPSVTVTSAPPPTPTPLPTAIPVTYTVQPGDTLGQIAALYGVSIVELAQLNGIFNYDALSVGQVLTIPG